jgi:hypothetical protein
MLTFFPLKHFFYTDPYGIKLQVTTSDYPSNIDVIMLVDVPDLNTPTIAVIFLFGLPSYSHPD